MTKRHILGALALTLLAGTASALAGGAAGVEARQGLMREYPGVRVYEDGPRTRIIYGRSMNTAATPREAIDGWLAEHSAAFGVGDLQLVETWSGDVRFGEFWASSYTQTLGGLPVEISPGRVLAHNNNDGTWSVVYAAGLFASMPEGGFAPMTRTAQDALNFVRSSQQFRDLPMWSGAELVAWQRETDNGFEGVRAWKFVGENPDLLNRVKYTFFVDASTGALLEARDEVHNIDVFGFVKGKGTTNLFPDSVSNPPGIIPINDIRVQVSGGNNAYTDTTGFFNITHGGSSNVTISANFDTGRWCNINDQSGTGVQSKSGTATPGSEAYLEFNSTPSQFLTAQVNGFIHTGLIHNFIRDRSSWTGMDFVCTTNVNLGSSCNAFFDGGSINFYRAGGSCPNMAYSTIVAHEYGHYIVARQGLSQGSFGEGYGDSAAQMLYDTGVVGEDFFGPGNELRDNETFHKQYPCSDEIHECGRVLGGCWRWMRNYFGDSHGSQAGLEMTQQLFVDWTIITTGGSGNNGAHPGTAIEVLTLDDNDGNLDNGTPNYFDIEAAFELHGIPVPDLIPLLFNYPAGVPDEVAPDGGSTVEVIVTGNAGFTPEPGTGVLHVDTGSGFVSIPMSQIQDNRYVGEFPGGLTCGDEVFFYVTADSLQGIQGRDPKDGPNGPYRAVAALSYAEVANDNFETNTGWNVFNVGTPVGAWERGIPAVQGGSAPGEDFDGSGRCYLTGNFLINSDVDNGTTRLRSPTYDISGLTSPTVSFAYWFYDVPANDTLLVEITDDGGASWHTALELTNGGKAWYQTSFAVRDILPNASQVSVRISASDPNNNSDCEAAIDAFTLTDLVCSNPCYADFNGDGNVNTQDVLAFLNAWNAGDSSSDCNGDGSVNTVDVLCFLNLWNAGC